MIEDERRSGLARWSRRKLEAAQETTAKTQSPPAVEAELPIAAPLESEAQPVLTDADMPAVETLDENSDFSGFMSTGVSDELRNLALRKLFKAPVFNIRDGLDEYDEDYTYFEKLGDIVTCDMKHQIEMQQQKLRDAQTEEQAAGAVQPVEELDVLENQDDIERIDDSEQIEDEAELDPVNDSSLVAEVDAQIPVAANHEP